MPPSDRQWCATADKATTCPQLKAMCDRKWEGSSFMRWLFGRREGKVDSDSSAGGAMRRMLDAFSFSLPGAQVVLWTVLGLVMAVVLAVIVRAIMERERKRAPPTLADAAPTGLEIPDPGLGPVQSMLQQALRAADEDVGLAFRWLYAAILRYLEDHALIRWDAFTTNREYVRAVRGRTPLDTPMAQVVREVERSKFGHLTPERTKFDALFLQVQRLVSVAPLLLVVLLGASCTGCEMGDPNVDGHAAITEILESQGIKSSRLAAPLETLSSKDSPVILDLHELTLDKSTLHSIERATLAGARIMLLLGPMGRLKAWPSVAVRNPSSGDDGADDGDDDVSDDTHETGGIGTKDDTASTSPAAGPAPSANAEATDGGAAVSDAEACQPAEAESVPLTPVDGWAESAHLGGDTTGYLPEALFLDMPELDHDPPEVLIERDEAPFAVRWQTQDGELVAVADRRLFSNASMAVPSNARLAVALVRELAGAHHEVSFGALTASSASQSPAESLFNAGILPLLLQTLLVLAIVFASRGLAFGTLRDRDLVPSPLPATGAVVVRRGRRVFAEHVTALGQQFQRVKGSRFAASLYVAYAFDRIRARLGRDVDSHDLGSMAQVLASRLGRPEDEVRATLGAAEAVRQEPNAPSRPSEDLSLIQRVGEYLAALQRE